MYDRLGHSICQTSAVSSVSHAPELAVNGAKLNEVQIEKQCAAQGESQAKKGGIWPSVF